MVYFDWLSRTLILSQVSKVFGRGNIGYCATHFAVQFTAYNVWNERNGIVFLLWFKRIFVMIRNRRKNNQYWLDGAHAYFTYIAKILLCAAFKLKHCWFVVFQIFRTTESFSTTSYYSFRLHVCYLSNNVYYYIYM